MYYYLKNNNLLIIDYSLKLVHNMELIINFIYFFNFNTPILY